VGLFLFPSHHTPCYFKIYSITFSLTHMCSNLSILKLFIFVDSGIVLYYGLHDLWFKSRQEMRIFLFTTASRPALGPTKPLIQWVTRALSPGVKRPWREADHSPPSSAEVKNAWSYTSTPPIRLHGVVLS
jgi:hypothetical protein